MKLKVVLALALGTACSAFALNGNPASASVARTHASAPPAFVRPLPESSDLRPGGRGSALRASSSAVAASPDDAALSAPRGGGLGSLDVPLLVYFALWYLGNYFYNISNKLALKASGGAAGYPMTISALQLGIGSLYGIFLWLAPDAREKPSITLDDVSAMPGLVLADIDRRGS